MAKQKKSKGVTVKIGERTITAYKYYDNNTITAIEDGKEVYHGNPRAYHKWIREQKKLKK